MRNEVLNQQELEVLFLQDAETAGDGGFQSLMVKLQGQCVRPTGEITLHDDDLERIPRYAFDYSNGGWENRLVDTFSRTLGPQLGR